MNCLNNQSPTYKTAYLMQYYGVIKPHDPIDEEIAPHCSLTSRLVDNYLQDALNASKKEESYG